MLTIGTVWTGEKFSYEYLTNLFAMVSRAVHCPYNFVCITDHDCSLPRGVERVEAESGIWGWWHYMRFYDPNFTPGNARVYLGLDVVLRGDITPRLVSLARGEEYTLSLDFNYLAGNANPEFAGTFADAPALIPETGIPWLYQAFLAEHQERKIGMSPYPMHLWVTYQLKKKGIRPKLWQDIDPMFTTSFKWPKPKLEEPEELIINWHGEPMVHECLEMAPWIKKYWNHD